MHNLNEPAMLNFGTPVVLLGTLNEDGTTNIAPMPSVWWLGWSGMLGLDATSKTTENLGRTRECVLNLPDASNVDGVNRLALLTGSRSVPRHKMALGYRYAADKWEASGFTPLACTVVEPQRIKECPLHLEARVAHLHDFARHDARMAVPACAVEVNILRLHARGEIMEAGSENRIDPDRWRPLIMSFRHFYGLTNRLHPSRLSTGPEERYAPWKNKA